MSDDELDRLRAKLAVATAERDAFNQIADRWYRTSQELVVRAEAAEARLAEAERVIEPFAKAQNPQALPKHFDAAAKFMESKR